MMAAFSHLLSTEINAFCRYKKKFTKPGGYSYIKTLNVANKVRVSSTTDVSEVHKLSFQ